MSVSYTPNDIHLLIKNVYPNPVGTTLMDNHLDCHNEAQCFVLLTLKLTIKQPDVSRNELDLGIDVGAPHFNTIKHH